MIILYLFQIGVYFNEVFLLHTVRQGLFSLLSDVVSFINNDDATTEIQFEILSDFLVNQVVVRHKYDIGCGALIFLIIVCASIKFSIMRD
jgi:hypothetical protein